MPAINSCGGCERRWWGTAEAHCAGCHESFSTPANFDRHRVDGRCVDPATLTGRNGNQLLRPVERPGGPVWVSGTPHPIAAARAATLTPQSPSEETTR